MTDLLSIHTALCLIFVLVVSNEQRTAFANDSCQVVYPSEYAFQRNSVHGSERSSANCRPYESGLDDTTKSFTEDYTHCDGSQLILTDSELGSEKYNGSDYYVWNGGTSGHQLLFIFPTRVNLTTTTLHYYSDSTRGLPRLRFFAVPYDFDIWDTLVASYRPVDITAVPLGEEPAGLKNVSVKIEFINVKKVLFYKTSSSYIFAASEVEFFTCNTTANSTEAPTKSSVTTIQTTTNFSSLSTSTNSMGEPTESSSTTTQTTTTFSYLSTSTVKESVTETTDERNATDSNNNSITSTENRAATGDTSTDSGVAIYTGTGIAIAIAILLLLTVIAAIALVLMRKSAHKRKVDYDSSYSTLCRESGQQHQSQSLHTSTDLYDQIQLSPSTGQAEFISRNETANTNNPAPHQTEYGIHPSVDKDKPKSAKLKITASTISTQDEDKSTSEQPTYAVVNKKKKQKTEKESVHCQSKDIAEVHQNDGVTEQNAVEHGNYLQEKQDSPDTTTQFPSQTTDSLQELYTAVKKKPHASTAGDDEEAPQIPPHTIEELYTAVQKKPKANATVDEEEAPPIPAHTVEELYTAVVKKPKASTAEDEEEAPPVPPYTVDEL